MAKTRENVCIHYICEGNCGLGKEGTFRHKCQACDNRKKKLERIQRKEDPVR